MPKIPVDKVIATTQTGLAKRLEAMRGLLGQIDAIPPEWLIAAEKLVLEGGTANRHPILPCNNYQVLLASWKKAMKWRQSMDDVLSTMLAVISSTMQIGDQLFLQVIGDAGGGKTRFCDAVLVSHNCYPLEHLTGFHSGYRSEDGEDHSLLARINLKCLITPEADVIMSSTHFQEIMSQQRRIFDGTSGASYKNQKEDKRYTGLRTPWIMAGTPALMDGDQSRVGDRFLKVFIDSPDADEKKDILRRVGFTAIRSVRQKHSVEVGKQMDAKFAEAYSLTGGYVDWLWANVDAKLTELNMDEEWVVSKCADLAEFTADMRARPDPDPKKDSVATKEMPTRLTHQMVRMACCMAVVLNKDTVDEEVIRRIHKVAMNTSYGVTLDIVKLMYTLGDRGIDVKEVYPHLGRAEDRIRALLRFLRAIDVVETFRPETTNGISAKPRWRLTERFSELYDLVGVTPSA